MNKKRIFLCFGLAFIIIIFTFLSTIVWYHFFDKQTEEKLIINQLYISNNGPQVIDQIGIDDANAVAGNTPQVYSFTVENTSNQDLSYKLLINEVAPSLLTDGCEEDDLLTRDQLIYQLTVNGEVIAKDRMDTIKDDTIDVKTIKSGSVNHYELSFWVESGQKDYLDKHYHFQINLSV